MFKRVEIEIFERFTKNTANHKINASSVIYLSLL